MTRTISSYDAKSIDELPTLWDGFAKLVRAGLDITAFGANIMDLPPDYSTTSCASTPGPTEHSRPDRMACACSASAAPPAELTSRRSGAQGARERCKPSGRPRPPARHPSDTKQAAQRTAVAACRDTRALHS